MSPSAIDVGVVARFRAASSNERSAIFEEIFHGHRDQDAPVSCDGHDSGHDYKEELKVGTESNQRVLAIRPRGNGSEFAVVYVRTREGSDEM